MPSEPVAELHEAFSSPGASATSWTDTRSHLEAAEIYWVSTVRPDGRPHVTPVVGVYVDGSSYFTTGSGEQKAKNLTANPQCVLATGCNALHEGLDVVVEGKVQRITEASKLQRIADAFEAKYGSEWHFDVRDDAFAGEGGKANVFEVVPAKTFAYSRGAEYAATRFRFARDRGRS